MRKQQLCHHHGAASLDFVHIEVKRLQGRAVLKGLSQVLRALTLDLVSHKIQIQKTNALADEISECTSSNISDHVVAQVYLINVDGIALQSRADDDQMVVSDTVREHILVVSVNDNV